MAESESDSMPLPRDLGAQDAGRNAKGYRGVAMEGSIARWYARTRGTPSQLAAWAQQAAALAAALPEGANVLEVAPGRGYFAVELARTGRLRVSALEISRTFVEIASENARRAGVNVAIRQGDASRMPYPADSFDWIICQAAFKNFRRPQVAIGEMFRVLRPGGRAVNQDMHRGARDADIEDEVRRMRLGAVRAFITGRALKSLRWRAYSRDQLVEMAALSPFGGAHVALRGIEIEVSLVKPVAAESARPPA